MNSRKRLEETFGEKALNHALFYTHDNGLRFELSEGDSPIALFNSACNKANEILDKAFEGSDTLLACLVNYDKVSFLSHLSLFKSLKACQITLPKNSYETWRTCNEEDGDRLFILFPITTSDIPKLLKGTLALELGIEPQINASLYIASIDKGLLAHPYDDRGMDIIGPNTALKKTLFDDFQNYLLAYDIETMRASFDKR